MSDQLNSSQQIFPQFIAAIRNSSPEMVEGILRNHDPAIVNQIQPQFREPSLYFAALINEDEDAAEMIKLLIRNGANVKFKDHNQQTILFYICRDGKEKCAELMLSHGLSLDDLDIYGQTPMFYAVSEDRLEIVNKYSTKERVNHVDKLAKQTPIYYAVQKGHLNMTKLLIEKGADIAHLDSTNKTVLDFAKKAKVPQITDYLNAEFRKIKDFSKSSNQEQNDKKSGKRLKEDVSKEAKQTYRIVFCPEKGEPRDLSEEDVRHLLAQRPQLANSFENPDEIPSQTLAEVDGDSWQKAAHKVLTQCSKLKGSYYFVEPVDPVKFNIMDYFDIITQPMDLGTVKKKLSHNCYKTPEEFITDMNLIWQNSYRYNGQNHVVSKCGSLRQSQGLNAYLGREPVVYQPLKAKEKVVEPQPLPVEQKPQQEEPKPIIQEQYQQEKEKQQEQIQEQKNAEIQPEEPQVAQAEPQVAQAEPQQIQPQEETVQEEKPQQEAPQAQPQEPIVSEVPQQNAQQEREE